MASMVAPKSISYPSNVQVPSLLPSSRVGRHRCKSINIETCTAGLWRKQQARRKKQQQKSRKEKPAKEVANRKGAPAPFLKSALEADRARPGIFNKRE